MRNGNFFDIAVTSAATVTSSYRTYEEWKLNNIFTMVSGGLMVLTVPMRNGNIV